MENISALCSVRSVADLVGRAEYRRAVRWERAEKSRGYWGGNIKLIYRRENKELAKTNLKNMDRTMQELRHIGSIKDLRPQNT